MNPVKLFTELLEGGKDPLPTQGNTSQSNADTLVHPFNMHDSKQLYQYPRGSKLYASLKM
jgi:hypothetical protein